MSDDKKGDNGKEIPEQGVETGIPMVPPPLAQPKNPGPPQKGGGKPNFPIMRDHDRLRAENLQLKLMNMALQEKELMGQLESVQATTVGLQKKYIELQAELSQKYGVDLVTSQVRSSDGAIIPRVSSGSAPQPIPSSPKP